MVCGEKMVVCFKPKYPMKKIKIVFIIETM